MKGKTNYEDIINLPHHVSSKRPQMSMLDRAAQFSPFAALTGYDDAIHETGRLTDEKIDLSEEEKEANIFSRFEKLNETAQGSGLGLSICQLIIERIGGKIWIDPAYTDGCRFCFTHPVRPMEERKEEQA